MSAPAPNVFRLGVDVSALRDALAALSLTLPTLPETLLEVVQGFFDAVQSGDKRLFLEGDCLPATGAHDLLVVIKPSDDLLALMTTVGARDV